MSIWQIAILCAKQYPDQHQMELVWWSNFDWNIGRFWNLKFALDQFVDFETQPLNFGICNFVICKFLEGSICKSVNENQLDFRLSESYYHS